MNNANIPLTLTVAKFEQLVIAGWSRARVKLSNILGGEIPFDSSIKCWVGPYFDRIKQEFVKTTTDQQTYVDFCPRVVQVSENSELELLSIALPEAGCKKPDQKQLQYIARCLCTNTIVSTNEDDEEEIRIPVYFYQNGSVMEWVFKPFDILMLCIWEGSQVKKE